MNKVVMSSSAGAIKHYGVKGMKWDEEKIKKQTAKLETRVENTIERKTGGNEIFSWPISDEKVNKVEADVQREKEIVEGKIKKAEAFLKKQKDIEMSSSVFKIMATPRKKKAVEKYLSSLKISASTLAALKKKMEKLPRTKKKALR